MLTFPAGERVEGVVELGDPVAGEMYGPPRPSHHVIGPWQEAISRFLGRRIEFLWADDGAVDRTPGGGTVSFVSEASLERLREEMRTGGAVDGRRFRMLFEIDGVDAHEADRWMGREVRVGEATIVVKGDIGRCVDTSRDPDTGVVDLPTIPCLSPRARRTDGRAIAPAPESGFEAPELPTDPRERRGASHRRRRARSSSR